MAPKRERGVVRKVKQSAAAERAKAASARAAPRPPPRVAQALFSPSVYAAEEMLVRVRRALAAEFLGALLGKGLPPAHQIGLPPAQGAAPAMLTPVVTRYCRGALCARGTGVTAGAPQIPCARGRHLVPAHPKSYAPAVSMRIGQVRAPALCLFRLKKQSHTFLITIKLWSFYIQTPHNTKSNNYMLNPPAFSLLCCRPAGLLAESPSSISLLRASGQLLLRAWTLDSKAELPAHETFIFELTMKGSRGLLCFSLSITTWKIKKHL